MKTFYVTVDVNTTYYAEVKADDIEEASQIAQKQAYEDTWSCTAIHSGSEVYDVEELSVMGELLKEKN